MNAFPFDDPASLAPRATLREDIEGGFVLRHPEPLAPHARCIGEWLQRWASEKPDALFLAERDTSGGWPDGWRRLTYRDVREQVGRIAQSLLDLNLAPGKPVVTLSDNSVDAALLALATMHIGRAICTVSSAYCRLTKDYSKIAGILDALDPALVYACDAAVYGPAIAAWDGSDRGVPVMHSLKPLLEATETPEVMRAFAAVQPDDHAKYLLTSGSTGVPKVVINTHRMLCANQQMVAQVWPFLQRHPLVLVDWLPWSHTFGANHNFNMVLAHGGSLYVDEGRPAPGLIEKTLRNLRDVKPNFWFNVPRGFDMLLPYLEQDEAAARDVFANLEGVFYAGAALPQSVWQRLEAVAARVRPRPVWFTSAWGSTETSPAATEVHWPIERAGCIGLPLPGVELKFVRNAGKLEMRVRGPSVFPGYRNAPELTAKAFDEDGFYLIGDAGKLVDPADPTQGVAFDGRVAEDFKLTSGTWVSVGTLRTRVVTAMAPHVADVVVTGHDREEVGVLVFPTIAAKTSMPAEVLRAHVQAALRAMAAEGAGSSQTPMRAIVLDEPPSADAGEITDKGYINQRAVLFRRSAEVQALYAGGDARVITCSSTP
jgi:feruloyl-CoA synthase